MLVRGRIALALCWLCLPACVDGAANETPLGGVNTAGAALGGSAGNTAGAGGAASAGAAQGGSGLATGQAGSQAGSAGLGGSTAFGGSAGSGVAAGGAMACANYADEAAWKLKIQIKNERSTAVYLGEQQASCGSSRLFQVADGSNTELPGLEACRNSCSAVMTSGPVVCATACVAPSTVTLDPGQTITLPWDGLFGVTQSLPQGCLQGGAQAPASCVQAAKVSAGPYTFKALAGTRRDCPSGTTCTCAPNTNGGCTTASSTISGTIITTEFFVLLEPGELSPSGEPQFIGLVFKD